MYEEFGGIVDQKAQTVTFKLFIPDGERAPYQYEGGGLPRLTSLSVVGGFQNPATKDWSVDKPIPMVASDYTDPASKLLKGTVYSYTSGKLPPGFYEYKYIASFEDADPRYISDPCSRYGGTKNQNSAFVVGGTIETVTPIAARLDYADLMVYELMIDDFTAKLPPGKAPLDAIIDKLKDIKALGINAIEFMPWTAWPDDNFSWGYNPFQYFSVANRYTLDPTSETDKLVYLKRLISACHKLDIHVIMDGVFNHAESDPPDRGFPYYWLYQDPADSPYVGDFAQAAFFDDLDYANQCVLEYIRDACFYWIDTFKIDGIRFDNTLGFYKPDDRGHGLPKLLSELRAHFSKNKIENFSLILEHSWDYSAIDVVNKVGATSCWLDMYRSQTMNYLGNQSSGAPQIETPIMRLLNSAESFAQGRTPTIYIENHDHKRFMLKAGGIGKWYLTQPYVIALFTSAGATLIYNGQEFGMSNDMPESGDGRVVPRPLDWDLSNSEAGKKVIALYTGMMSIRNAHPGLRSQSFYPDTWDESVTQRDANGYGIDRNNNLVVYHRWGQDGAGKKEFFYVVLNFAAYQQNVSFRVNSPGPWVDLIGGPNFTQGSPISAPSSQLNVNVGSNWGAVFYTKS